MFRVLLAFVTALGLARPALAGDLEVADAYFRTASPVSTSGAAYMVLRNAGDRDDRLVAVESDAAAMVQLHSHGMTDGVVQMAPIEGGLPLPAGEERVLARGGDHVMLMGLAEPAAEGSTITLTLRFAHAEPMVIEVPLDRSR